MTPVLSNSCGKREEVAKEIHFPLSIGLTVRGLRCGSAQQKRVVGVVWVGEERVFSARDRQEGA